MKKRSLRARTVLLAVAACFSLSVVRNAHAQATINFTVTGTINNDDASESPRLFRDNNPSVYTTNKTFPGTSGSGNYHYDAYSFTNTNPFAEAVFINLSTTVTTTANLPFSEAYLTSFDPANLATNYRGDAGFSQASPDGMTAGTTPYSISVPANTTFIVLVNETTAGAGVVSYTLTVNAVPEPSTWALLGLGATGAGLIAWKRRRQAVVVG